MDATSSRDFHDYFVGRCNVLKKLHTDLEEQKNDKHSTVLSRMFIITGLPGIGKTETARRYAKVFHWAYGNCIWVNAKSHSQMRNSFIEVSRKFKIPSKKSQREHKDSKYLALEVYSVVFREPCLIVFDGANSLNNDAECDGIKEFLPQSIKTGWHIPAIIVTTRNRNWLYGNIIELTELSFEEGHNLLSFQLKFVEPAAIEKFANIIYERYGGIPIVLQQVISGVQNEPKNSSWLNYFRNFHKSKDILSIPPFQPENQPSIIQLLEEHFEELQKKEHGSFALKYLHLLALLYHDNIPTKFVHLLLENEDSRRISYGLHLLHQNSLITMHDVFCRIHPIVQYAQITRSKNKGTTGSISSSRTDLLETFRKHFPKSLPREDLEIYLKNALSLANQECLEIQDQANIEFLRSKGFLQGEIFPDGASIGFQDTNDLTESTGKRTLGKELNKIHQITSDRNLTWLRNALKLSANEHEVNDNLDGVIIAGNQNWNPLSGIWRLGILTTFRNLVRYRQRMIEGTENNEQEKAASTISSSVNPIILQGNIQPQIIAPVLISGAHNSIQILYSPKPKPERIEFNIQESISSFFGRDEFLKKLHEDICQKRNETNFTVRSKSIVICGMHGVGKTQLVRKYVELYKKSYDHVLWINAENQNEATNCFLRLASSVGIATYFDDKPKQDLSILEEVYDFVCRKFALIIFDNVRSFKTDDGEDGLHLLLPQAVKTGWKVPAIIVTTRNRYWPNFTFRELTGFDLRESLSFLSSLKSEETEENRGLLEEIANVCQGLPLGLQQVVTFYRRNRDKLAIVSNNAYTLKELLTDVASKKKKKFLSTKPSESSTVDLYTLFDMTFEQLGSMKNGELTLQCLDVMSILNPHCIPTVLMTQIFKHSKSKLNGALTFLYETSLVARCDRYYQIHPLVQSAKIESSNQNCSSYVKHNLIEIIESATLFLETLSQNSETVHEILDNLILLHNQAEDVHNEKFLRFQTILVQQLENIVIKVSLKKLESNDKLSEEHQTQTIKRKTDLSWVLQQKGIQGESQMSVQAGTGDSGYRDQNDSLGQNFPDERICLENQEIAMGDGAWPTEKEQDDATTTCDSLPAIAIDLNMEAKIIAPTFVTGNSHYIISSKTSTPWTERIEFNIQESLPSFIGREEFINELHQDIQQSWEEIGRVRSKAIVIGGHAGVGKTQVVRKYIELYKCNYDHVIWINAESYDEATNCFLRLALRVGIDPNFNGKPKCESDIFAEIYNLVCRKYALIVFDNVETFKTDDGRDGLHLLLPNCITTGWKVPAIIVTTRNRDWPNFRFRELPGFDLNESLSFLSTLEVEYTEENRHLLEEVAKMFQGLPSVLQQIISFVRIKQDMREVLSDNPYTLKDLLIDFTSNKMKKIITTRSSDSEYPDVYAIFDMTFEDISCMKYGELALQCLDVMSVLNPDCIPSVLIKQIFSRSENQLKLAKALALLHKYTLVTRRDFYYQISRMVQVAKIESSKANGSSYLKQNFEEILDSLNSFLETLPTNSENVHEILNNCIRLHDQVDDNNSHRFLKFQAILAKQLQNIGSYRSAITLRRKNLELLETFWGENDTITIKSKTDLSWVLLQQGYYDEANEIYSNVLKVQGNLLGPNHPLILNTKNNLALVFDKQGKYEAAQRLYNEVLETRIKLLGPDHPQTITIKHNLATVLDKQGKYDEALEIYNDVLKIRIATLGTDHPSTITTKHNLAAVFDKQGKYDEAEELYNDVLKLRINILGPEHPHTLNTKNNLAAVFDKLGKYDIAQALCNEVLQLLINILGLEHPHTLNTKSNLALLFDKQEKYDEALELYYDVLKTQINILGPDHPNTLNTKYNLALAIKNQGKYDEAQELYNDVLKARIDILGPEHPQTIITMCSLATVYEKLGKFKEAQKLYIDVLKILIRQLGPDDPLTLSSTFSLASVFDKQRKYKDAQELYLDVLKVRTRILSPDDPQTLNAKHTLAMVLKKQGQFVHAEQLFNEVLKTRLSMLSSDHLLTLDTKHNLALVLVKQDKYDAAVDLYNDVLTVQINKLGLDHPHTLITKHNLALAFKKQGKCDQAYELFTEVLKARIKVLGPDHPQTRNTKQNLDLVLKK